jgi:hypothetical protein
VISLVHDYLEGHTRIYGLSFVGQNSQKKSVSLFNNSEIYDA